MSKCWLRRKHKSTKEQLNPVPVIGASQDAVPAMRDRPVREQPENHVTRIVEIARSVRTRSAQSSYGAAERATPRHEVPR
jgi:hypothetical protein